jgi:hypothetical protein
MAFHERQTFMKAWVIKDRPQGASAALAGYTRWLQYREDLDIGYTLANPGKVFQYHMLHFVCHKHSPSNAHKKK